MWEFYHKECWTPKNLCFWTVVLEKTLESPLDNKEIKSVNPKVNQPWIHIGRSDAWRWSSNTLATWWEELTHWKRLWCWGFREGGEGDNREWDGKMASVTQQTWVWANSRRQWRTEKPGILQSIELQRVGQDWMTEQKKKKEEEDSIRSTLLKF